MSFESDIQGQNTQLYPIVVIERGEESDGLTITPNYIFLSTNNVNIDLVSSDSGLISNPTVHCKPLLLNIPSIKESVDVESRKFKISNVSLDISNYEYEGKRFTDILSETSLINTPVSIYFKSPSTTWVSSRKDIADIDKDNLCPLVFKGIIRRISHDDEKVKVELEDLTEQKAHKDLPQAIDQNGVVGYLGSGDDILDKYKNKPIPMVYGEVDRSPAVIGFSSSGHKLLFDSKPYSKLNAENTLFVNSDDHYLNILERLSYNDSDLFDDLDKGDNWEDPQKQDIQYEIFDDYVLLNVKTGNGDGIAPSILFDTLLCYYVSPASSWSIRGLAVGSGNTNGSVYPTGDLLLPEDFPEYAVDSNSDTICSIPPINTEVTWSPSDLEDAGLQTLRMTNAITSLVINASVPSNERFQVNYVEINGVKINYFDAISQSSPESSRWLVDTADDELDLVGEGLGTTNLDEANDFAVNMASLFDIDDNSNAPIKIETYGATEVLKINSVGTDNASISFSLYGWRTNAQLGNNVDAAIYGNFNDIKVAAYVYPDRILSNNFFANVKGRINTFDDHPQLQVGSVDYFQENSEQVADFLYGSLFNEAPQYIQEYATAYPNLNTTDSAVLMNYIDQLHEVDFIQNPIDIIYDLVRSEIGHDNIDEAEYAEAKAAHDGWQFGFTVNKKISSKKLIEEIAKSTKCFPKFKNDGSFGFNTVKDSYTLNGDYVNATPIKESEVISYSFKKTKPEQIYRKVTVSYNKEYAQDSYLKTAFSEDLGADSYYGIEDSADAHLEFESDYIRHSSDNGETANNLASFLLEQYKNDHLIFNLKLPLQYIDLEIGDLVKFEKLFQGVKAYGINYTTLRSVNFQTRYPLFMVTSTTKNLDSVSVECMQLHALGNVDNSDWDDEVIEPEDTTAPIITFGSASLSYTVGDAFVPFAATAVDDTDGEVDVDITYRLLLLLMIQMEKWM